MKMHKQNLRILLQIAIVLALILNIYLVYSFSGSSQADSDDLRVIVLTTPDCEDCYDFQEMIDFYKDQGITDNQIEYIEYDSFKGKRLTKNNGVGTVPSVLVEGPINQYPFLQELIGEVASLNENTLVFNDGLLPPYLEVESGEKRGDFEMIYLTDASCEECYDVDLHKPSFGRNLMVPIKETYVDIADDEGVTLIEEYAINAIPTILLRGDLEVYNQLNEYWSFAGTIEEDGTYVFRQGVASMGTYKSLPSGAIVVPENDSEIDE